MVDWYYWPGLGFADVTQEVYPRTKLDFLQPEALDMLALTVVLDF